MELRDKLRKATTRIGEYKALLHDLLDEKASAAASAKVKDGGSTGNAIDGVGDWQRKMMAFEERVQRRKRATLLKAAMRYWAVFAMYNRCFHAALRKRKLETSAFCIARWRASTIDALQEKILQ